MEIKFVLDFDGVLFNSAFEAYSVCQQAIDGDEAFLSDVSFEEFLEFRAVVTDAWQYNRLFSKKLKLTHFAELPSQMAVEEDWAFSRRFFETRKVMMTDPEWPKIMSPYDFFFLIRPYFLARPDRFAILSTRNTESIRQTMAFYGTDVLPIFGQEDIRRLGSKVAVAESENWLAEGKYFIVYVDDMNAHLEPFEGKVHLPLHANWGYDHTSNSSLTQHQIVTIISSMLKLS